MEMGVSEDYFKVSMTSRSSPVAHGFRTAFVLTHAYNRRSIVNRSSLIIWGVFRSARGAIIGSCVTVW